MGFVHRCKRKKGIFFIFFLDKKKNRHCNPIRGWLLDAEARRFFFFYMSVHEVVVEKIETGTTPGLGWYVVFFFFFEEIDGVLLELPLWKS